MADGGRERREAAIFEAAYRLLNERGYAGTSMLNVAKAANASNETLYRWYGDKRGLFARMIEENARTVRQGLAESIEEGAEPIQSLRRLAPVLLSMLLGERAISLNRAAASDETGELGRAIAANGRDAVAPELELLVERALQQGIITAASASAATEWFIALLVSDLQVRRINRVLPQPTQDEVARRAQDAVEAFLRLGRPIEPNRAV